MEDPAMDAKRLDEVEHLFHRARQHAPEDRAAFLDGACSGDLTLRAEVESLLAHGTQEPDRRSVAEPVSRVEERCSPQEGPGSVIGPYKLLQALGEGGFGIVYMAEQRVPVRRRVALKVIKLGMDTKQVIARFEAERQALALMDHPNIAKVLDAGATQTGRPYFVMELVRGVPITEYCDKAQMGTDERLRLFTLVCRAVQHAHQKGIVHRDIKPSNILVTLHDGEPVPKVIDFGIAKATNQELTEKTVFTEFRQFIGTPEYMSPEQAEMSGLDIDTRADVYSLGVLLYELLTGTTPVDPTRLRTAGYEEMQRILCEEDPERPSARLSTMGGEATVVARRRREEPEALTRSLRGDLDAIVIKALEKDRSRRYESASAFAQDIERHLAHEPIVASPPGRYYRMRKFVRRNRGPVLAAAGLIAVFLLGISGTTVGFLRARDALRGEREVRALAERSAARATEEAERHRAIARFFESSLLASAPWRFEGAGPARVVDLLDLAAERLTSGEVSDQPTTKAMLAQALGDAYMVRDRWESAVEHFRLAVDSLGDPSVAPLTFSRAARELDRIDAEDYFELEVGVDVDVVELRERALAGLRPLVEARYPEVAFELFEWAHQDFLRGGYRRAADLLRVLLDLVVDTSEPAPHPSIVRFNLACAEARLGNREEALQLYTQATEGMWEIVRRGDSRAADEFIGGCEHPDIGLVLETGPPLVELIQLALERYEGSNLGKAESLWNAAIILQDVGSAEESHRLMLECVEIARGFEENRLMLGSALTRIARFEWDLGKTEAAVEHASEARPLLRPTRGRPYRLATHMIIAAHVDRIVADPASDAGSTLVGRVIELAEESGRDLDHARGPSALVPWWMICGELARMHRTLADSGAGEEHRALAQTWNDRLRRSLEPHLEPPPPAASDIACTALARALLALGDATRDELELALTLSEAADDAAGGQLAPPVAAHAEALYRLGDVEGAVREGRRALGLTADVRPMRGLEERVRKYEAVLAGR
jgi:serine/threonine protein kinase